MRLDSTHIVLEKIRVMLNLLRKSNIFNESSQKSDTCFYALPIISAYCLKLLNLMPLIIARQRENPLLTKFKDLQNIARHSSTTETLDPLEVVMPFLLILRAPHTTGPFKLAVVDALQAFIQCDVLCDCPGGNTGTAALNELIDAVIKCKFVQTDVLGDELLQLQIVQTLHGVIVSPVRRFLTNGMTWQLLEFGFNLLITTGGVGKSLALHQETERTVLDVIKYVAQCSSISCRASLLSSIPVAEESAGRGIDVLGVPCMLTCVAYLLSKLKQRIATKSPTSSNGSASAIKAGIASPITTASRDKLSHASLMDMLNQDADTLHLIFALKALQVLVMMDGDSQIIRNILVSSRQFYSLIVDSLVSNLFTLATLRDCYPPVVLQLTLSLFGSLCNAVGPSMGVLVECFCRDIYTKALFQTHEVFSSEVAYHGSLDHIIAPNVSPTLNSATTTGGLPKTPVTPIPKTPGAAAASASGAPPGFQLGTTNTITASFKVDELEIIMESLNDLLSDFAFIPALFVSFDCNPSKANLLHPMVQLISSCSRIVLNCGSEELGSFRHLGVLLIQSFKQIMRSFEGRRSLCEQHLDITGKGGNDNSSSSSSATSTAVVSSRSSAIDSPSRNTVSVASLTNYFKAMRIAKSYLCEAAVLFAQKPSAGIKFLQQCGALPGEADGDAGLQPRHVANFLRTAPGLPKEAVGSYIGELGKDGASCHSVDRKSFHAAVLVHYVDGFEFGGHSLLTCMRMFLSVFRLPGEAQQIDRILEAFCNRCHAFANEGRSGVLENAEVTYLLCFSIIMLNTDRHNPNIRQDRKMTVDQFLKNNSNYGKDVNQTKPLPQDFLEDIYKQISEEPIRTEPDDMSAIITPEVLLNLQLQSRANFRTAVWVSSGHDSEFLRNLQPVLYAQHNTFNQGSSSRAKATIGRLIDSITITPPSTASPADTATDGRKEQDKISSSHIDTDSSHKLALYLIKNILSVSSVSAVSSSSSTPPPPCPLDLCQDMAGVHWSVDLDLLECIYRDLLVVGMGVFLSNHAIMTSKLAIEKEVSELEHITEELQARHDALPRERTGRLLQLSNDFLLDVVKLSSYFNLDHILDLSLLLLAEFSGILKCNSSKIFFRSEMLNCYRSLNVDEDSYEGLLSSFYAEIDEPNNFLYCLSYFSSARHALVTLLQLLQAYHPSISNWSLVWNVLGALRDAALVPPDLVLESDSDALPKNVRHDFELTLLALDAKIINEERPVRPSSIPKKQSSSLLSLQGLGEALFGAAATDESYQHDGGSRDSKSGDHNRDSYRHRAPNHGLVLIAPNDSVEGARSTILAASQKHNLNPFDFPSARWDAGYEQDEVGSTSVSGADIPIAVVDSDPTHRGSKSKEGLSGKGSNDNRNSTRHNAPHSVNEGKSHTELRMLVAGTAFSQLFSDSKFIPEDNLVVFLTSLISVVETKGCGVKERRGTIAGDPSSSSSSFPSASIISKEQSYLQVRPLLDDSARRRSQVLDLTGETHRQITALNSLSSSSAAWLEMMLVEVALSNRDRFGIVWPLLRQHFSTVLGGSAATLSYLTERRLVGLLKVSTRMISREQYAEALLELLGQLLSRTTSYPAIITPSAAAPSSPAMNDSTVDQQDAEDGDEDYEDDNGKGIDVDIDSSAENALMLAAETSVAAVSAVSSVHGVVPMRHKLLTALANQISAAIWRLLTLNVDILSLLPLGQWQSLFGIIAATATTGSYATVKSFETMAWLLHEPRLIAKVPVFCIVSIKPLLHNHEAPLSVSVGAVHLLTHLHSRLEVLIKDEDANPPSPSAATTTTQRRADAAGNCDQLVSDDPRDDDYDDSDTPVLWESCWVPVLKALGDGTEDSRPAVRRACVEALAECIQDKHSDAVPSSVLVDILGNVLSPVIIKLANHLQKELGKLVPESALSIDGLGDENPAAAVAAAALRSNKKPPIAPKAKHGPSDIVSALSPPAIIISPLKPEPRALQGQQSDICVCISAFHNVFLRQLRRLVMYPSFDRLWLRFLYILGYFIGNVSTTSSPYGIDCRLLGLVDRGAFPLDGSVPSLRAVVDLQATNELCTITLKSLVAKLKADNIFQIRDGLWVVTKETIKQFRHFGDFDDDEAAKNKAATV